MNLKPYATLEQFESMQKECERIQKEYYSLERFTKHELALAHEFYQKATQELENLEDALRSCMIETGESLHLICSFGEFGHSELSQAIKNSEQRKKKNA